MVAPVQELSYTPAFFEKISDEGLSSAKVVVPLIMKLICPKSVLDVGCGPGAWLSIFQANGVEQVKGLDGSWVSREQLLISPQDFHVVDLKGQWSLAEKFDLAISLEVGEHLPHNAADHLVAELTEAADAVLFSAALPGQQGTDHINEQWPEYWSDKFADQGFVKLDPIRRHIWQDPRVAWYYQQNIFLFVRERIVQERLELRQEQELNKRCALTLMHPKIFRQSTSVRASALRLCESLKRALRTRLAR